MPYIIYANIESLIRKIDVCANNLKKLSTGKVGEHIPCGYSSQQFGDLIIQKTSIRYIVEKIV